MSKMVEGLGNRTRQQLISSRLITLDSKCEFYKQRQERWPLSGVLCCCLLQGTIILQALNNSFLRHGLFILIWSQDLN